MNSGNYSFSHESLYSKLFFVWDKATGWIDLVSRVFMAAALLGILVMLLLQVAIRYVLPFPLPWAEEAAIYLSGYVAMIGTAVCLRANYHLQVDILHDKLPKRARLIHAILINLMVAAFAIFLIRYGYAFMQLGTGQTSPSDFFMISHARLAMPLGGALLFLQALTMAGRALDGLLAHKNDGDYSGGTQLSDP